MRPDITIRTIRLQAEADQDMKNAIVYAKTFDDFLTQIFPTPERKLPAPPNNGLEGSETARD